jgi:hypothetical protein
VLRVSSTRSSIDGSRVFWLVIVAEEGRAAPCGSSGAIRHCEGDGSSHPLRAHIRPMWLRRGEVGRLHVPHVGCIGACTSADGGPAAKVEGIGIFGVSAPDITGHIRDTEGRSLGRGGGGYNRDNE